MPGIISWPAVNKGPARESWDTVVTMDFLATVMDVLNVSRPEAQKDWHFDGVSAMPIIRGEQPAERGIGWMYHNAVMSASNGYAYRYGKWKMVTGGISCDAKKATFDCSKPQLYDMETDYAENHNLAEQYPDILKALQANFTVWYDSIHDSITNESMCSGTPSPSPHPFPKHPNASDACDFHADTALNGGNIASGSVASKEECCGACKEFPGCGAADFVEASAMRPTFQGITTGGTCNLKAAYSPKPEIHGEVQTACVPH